MSWTPHSKEALSNAGVSFGTGDSISGSPVIVYPNSDGTTGGSSYNYNYSSGDKYGGTPININTGNSAAGLQSLSATLGSGFEGLFDLIQQNTDKNNAWSAAQAQKQMDFQTRANQIAMDFNSLEAAKNRDFQMYMSNTAHQREIADLKAAGLNPVLSASGGNGAAVTSGATASGVTSSGSQAQTDTSANQAMTALYGALLNAKTQMYNANLSAQTNLAIADKQMQASMYGARLAAETARSGNPVQVLTGILDYVAGEDGNRGSGAKSIAGQAVDFANDIGKVVNDPNSYKQLRSKVSATLRSGADKVLGWFLDR